MNIVPIQTRYKGYLFRSRLEARWAVFFDQIRERYIYEDQGFQLPSGFYLPDFHLPKRRAFVEVKPASMLPTDNFEFNVSHIPICDDFPLELKFIYELSKATGLLGVVVYGDPLDAVFWNEGVNGGCVWTMRNCGLVATPFFFPLRNDPDIAFREVRKAAIAAREARFEHGETLR